MSTFLALLLKVFFLRVVKTPGWVKRQILDASKLKEPADDNFEFNQNGRKFSKWVENNVGKGEIAFKRLVLQTRKNQGLLYLCFEEEGSILF